MQIIALHNQNLADIAIRYCGTIEALAGMSILNNISITDELVPGQTLFIPNKDYGFQEVVNYFVANKIDPATAISTDNFEAMNPELGIGKMAIGSTFIVR